MYEERETSVCVCACKRDMKKKKVKTRREIIFYLGFAGFESVKTQSSYLDEQQALQLLSR